MDEREKPGELSYLAEKTDSVSSLDARQKKQAFCSTN
jgi:hypothetical protein